VITGYERSDGKKVAEELPVSKGIGLLFTAIQEKGISRFSDFKEQARDLIKPVFLIKDMGSGLTF